MCLDNRAENAAHFVNAQLLAHYENSRRCAEKHSCHGRKPDSPVIEQGTCLYQWYGGAGKHNRLQPSREDLGFYGAFGPPKVEFVCNHELILYLELLNGHYNLEYQNAKVQPKCEHHEKLSNFTLAFRVEFTTCSVDDFQCKEIGNCNSYNMMLHVLDVECATFVPELSCLPGILSVTDEKSFYTKDRKLAALLHYITKQYFHIFKRAGYHVLHCLPDFDNQICTTAHIDYSVISKRILSTHRLFGYSVEEINTYLRTLWLQAVSYYDHCGEHESLSVSKLFLAEHKTEWSDCVEDIHMHMYFGPLQIQALCKREVILYMDLQDLNIHFGDGFCEEARYRFKDWKLAFIVDIVFEESEAGCVKRIKLDMSSVRYCEHLSVLIGGCTCEEEEILIRIQQTLVRYIKHYYLRLFVEHDCHYIFHCDTRIHVDSDCTESESEDDGCACSDEDSCTCGYGGIRWGTINSKCITHTDTCGFDIITGVTQYSINVHLKTLWEAAQRRYATLGKVHTYFSKEIENETCQAEWSYVHEDHADEVFFSASFEAPRIQLLCEEGSQKVRFFVNLKEGYLRTLGEKRTLLPGSHAHSFANWRVAFDVELKIVDSNEETVADVLVKRLGGHDCHSFKHLILDFSTARFNLCLSSLPGLVDCAQSRLIRTLHEALVFYITKQYFPTLQRARSHILYSIPLVDSHGYQFHKHSLTSVKFQIFPFVHTHGGHFVEGLFGKQKPIFDRNMIVFLGMFDNRPMPCQWLPRGINWVCGTRTYIPHGVVCISRCAFLQIRILKLLEVINCDTTIVPRFSGIHCGKWVLKLTTWKCHEMKDDDDCKWVDVTKCGDSLDFEWKNRDEWRYEHEGDANGVGHYVVRCTTRNTVKVPTTCKRSITSIDVSGKVIIFLEYVGGCKDWHAEIEASWSSSIKFHSDLYQGLKVSVQPPCIVPKFEVKKTFGDVSHDFHSDVLKQLREQLPSTIEFGKLVNSLKEAFEGCWSGLHAYSREMHVMNPMFNRHGDLLLELGMNIPGYATATSRRASGVSVEGGYDGRSRNGYANGNTSYDGNTSYGSVLSPPPKGNGYGKVTYGGAPPKFSPPILYGAPKPTTSTSYTEFTKNISSKSSSVSGSSEKSGYAIGNGNGAAIQVGEDEEGGSEADTEL